jgi:hypothetical protein
MVEYAFVMLARDFPAPLVACALVACALVACGGQLSRSDEGQGTSTGPGDRPVVARVDPDTGPNSGGTSVRVSGSGFALDGGTLFTFAGAPALHVTCASDTDCTMASPPAGFTSSAQPVDVQATVGGVVGQSGARTSATNGNDVFRYAGGPVCSAAQDCGALADPELIVTCPATVSFFDLTSPSQSLATGTTYTTPMHCGSLAACFGSPSNGSCSTYSLNPPADACGDLKFCDKCNTAGGYCTSGPNPLCCYGSSLCVGPTAPCH